MKRQGFENLFLTGKIKEFEQQTDKE